MDARPFASALYTEEFLEEAAKRKNKKPRRENSGALGLLAIAAQVRLLLGGGCGLELRRFIGVFLGEAFDAASRINQLLLAGEKGMAVRTNFYANRLAFEGRAGVKRVAAGALNLHCVIIGMNSFFHGTLLLPTGLRERRA
jgi:hypothetical protein